MSGLIRHLSRVSSRSPSLLYHPDDVTLAETAVVVDGSQVFLSFFHTDEHAISSEERNTLSL